MKYPKIYIPEEQALTLEHFRDMDYFAVNNYTLPIELMMENAGLQLANLIASFAKKDQRILIGVGNGLTLAAPKKILYQLPSKTEIYIADLGIPKEVYTEFGVEALPFHKNNIIQLKTPKS